MNEYRNTDRAAAYRITSTLGHSQVDLILKVYDGAIGELEKAAAIYLRKNTGDSFHHLQKARKFVTHLYTTLNLKDGGEVAQNLSRLYAFVLSQLDLAEATKDSALLDDNITVLNNLRDGWKAVKDKLQEVSQTTSANQSAFANPALTTVG